MRFEDAFKKAAKAYFKGSIPTELKAASGKKMKYDKKYFDKVGKENDIEPIDLKFKKKGY